MRVPLVLLIAFVLCAATIGCGTTHTLKNSSSASIAPLPAVSAAPAVPPSPALPPASGTPHSDSVGRHSAPDPRPAQVAAPAKHGTTMSDRISSGIRIGSVGAFLGSFAGPIGFAAGGGTGFLIGFVAGQSPFGSAGGDVATGSWERQVAYQRAWEAQVHEQLARLDAQAQNAQQQPQPSQAAGIAAIPPAQGIPQTAGIAPAASGVPVPGAMSAAAGTDPVADYVSWSRQVVAYAQPQLLAPGDAPKVPAQVSPVRAVDRNGDGRDDAWLIYDGKTLRMQAVDRNGDGRPDREDLYEQGRLASRRLDDDGDGRFETIETIEGDQVTGWVMDLDGDGRYECRSVEDAEGVHHVERDADGDGRTDAWIMMVGEGSKAAVREQVDTDGDGKADTTTIYVNGHVVRQEDVDAKKAGTGS